MAIDKEKNTHVLVTFPIELLEQVEDYRFNHRFGSRNEAIRDLVKKGIESVGEKE